MASNHHCFMKPSSWDQQRLTSPLEYAVGPKTANTKTPTLKMRWGAECKSPQPLPPPEEGAGRSFFLDILVHRMSALACWQQLTFGGKENKCKPKLPIRELRAGHTASKPSLPWREACSSAWINTTCTRLRTACRRRDKWRQSGRPGR